ncbi:zinc-binding alcohol dehydrogenase family protein [Microbacterium sp. NPDC057650]|uniref:quinone oxidoreductase family protein n=1 Tax=unclassified Microbacterium TaxID=2609290 RepID=UPI00366D929A
MPRAAIYRRYGDSSVLEIEDIETPQPGPGMVRVRVTRSSVNPVDSKMRAGLLSGGAPLEEPAVAGMDVAGIVDAVGEGADTLSVGDRVAGLSPNGAAAEYIVTYAAALVRIPDGVSDAVASTIGVGGSTAVRALGEAGVGEGSVILVDGAAGGVGTFLTQLAVAAGATVIGTASPKNHDGLRERGVIPVDYSGDWQGAVREAADGRAIDAAFDLVTAGKYDAFSELVTEGGAIVTLLDPEVAERGGIIITGMEDGYDSALQRVIDGVAAGDILVPIEDVLPLERIAEAQDRSAAGHVRGKLVLAI